VVVRSDIFVLVVTVIANHKHHRVYDVGRKLEVGSIGIWVVCALYVDSEMKASRERSIQITYCKLLLEARLVHDRNYSSIPKYPELVKMCGTDKDLQGTVLDLLLNSTVYPIGQFPKYKHNDLASELMKSCGFAFNDGLAKRIASSFIFPKFGPKSVVNFGFRIERVQ
jgi:hypothetical protein